MKIALIGYGKMGKAIGQLAFEKGHDIQVYDKSKSLQELRLNTPDVAIEFTRPESAAGNVRFCLESGIPVVSGTTGWNHELSAVEELCRKVNGSFFYASNFSLGVNIFFRLNSFLAQQMKFNPQYEPSIKEIHHTQKKDAPSGTAITLAEGIIKYIPRYDTWSKETKTEGALPILSERTDPYPGLHTVTYQSTIDEISITHQAHSRQGFAAGALAVAEWLPGKKGVLSMSDFLPF